VDRPRRVAVAGGPGSLRRFAAAGAVLGLEVVPLDGPGPADVVTFDRSVPDGDLAALVRHPSVRPDPAAALLARRPAELLRVLASAGFDVVREGPAPPDREAAHVEVVDVVRRASGEVRAHRADGGRSPVSPRAVAVATSLADGLDVVGIVIVELEVVGDVAAVRAIALGPPAGDDVAAAMSRELHLAAILDGGAPGAALAPDVAGSGRGRAVARRGIPDTS